MDSKGLMAGAAVAAALVSIAAAVVAVSSVRSESANSPAYAAYAWPGMMGSTPAMMEPGIMTGPGMMTGQMPGRTLQSDLNLSAKDVAADLERWLAISGNPRLKLGPIAERDSGAIVADIVTTDRNVLVQRFEIDRGTGAYRSIQ